MVAELPGLRKRLAGEVDAVGLTVAVAGTRPLTVWEETQVSGAVRYCDLGDSLRVLARREPTMALHVHVGVPEPDDAIRVLNRLRERIPRFCSRCRPILRPGRGEIGGFASARTVIFQAFPGSGLPPLIASYADYVDAADALIASGWCPTRASLGGMCGCSRRSGPLRCG